MSPHKEKELKEMARRGAQSSKAKEQTRADNRKYLMWQHLTRNQKEVAKRVLQGRFELMQQAGWGFLDMFMIFLKTIGFLEVLNVKGEGFQRCITTVAQLLMTYGMKVLLGIRSMNQTSDMLFNDVGLLMLLGFTAKQIKKGSCKRGINGKKKKSNGPIHKDTLADALDRFGAHEVEHILNASVTILNKKGFIGDEIFICDSTDIETTELCQGRGSKTVEKELVDKEGKKVIVKETTYGFKLIVIRAVKSGIVVAATMTKIQEHEQPYMLNLVKQAEKNIGEGKIKVLLIDRGFIDGIDLWKLKHTHGIDFVIPSKTTMDITNDARGHRNSAVDRESGIWREANDTVEVVGIRGLTSYDHYGDEKHNKQNKKSKDFEANPLNVVMVTRWNTYSYPRGKEKVFLTTLRVDTPLSVIKKYSLRFLIENTTFRELKQGWLINSIPKKTETAMRTHAFLTLCMFNMCNAYRTHIGKKITEQGIRRFRRQTFVETRNKIVIISEEYYGIFDIEEYSILMGKPPKYFFSCDPKRFIQEYGDIIKSFSSEENAKG